MNFKNYFILFAIYSFIGWILEVFYTLFKNKKIVNRGFLLGSYCPIYGISCIFIIILLNRYMNDVFALFIMSMVICTILEYFTSLILEKLFNARWWNYSDRKFNINGRVCLEMAIPFGILGVLMMRFINPFLKNIILMLTVKLSNIIFILLLLIYLFDIIISLIVLFKLNIYSNKNISQDNTEEISKMVKEYIATKSWFGKRLIQSFPQVKILKNEKKKNYDVILYYFVVLLYIE